MSIRTTYDGARLKPNASLEISDEGQMATGAAYVMIYTPSFSNSHLHHAGCSLRVTLSSRLLVTTREKCTYFPAFHDEFRVSEYKSSHARGLWKRVGIVYQVLCQYMCTIEQWLSPNMERC